MPIPLVERSEREMARRIRKRIQSLGEVAECKEVTLGFTRKKPNIHFHALLKGNPSFEETHITCSKIDREVRSLVPNARVVIHSEPVRTDNTSDVWKAVKKTADSEPGSRGVQNIHLRRINGNLGVDFKLQLSMPMSRQQSEQAETRVSQKLKIADPRISEVVIHCDSVSHLVLSEQWGHGTELTSYLEHVARRFPEIIWIGPLTKRDMADGTHLTDRVTFRPGTSKDTGSRIRAELARAIKQAYPEIVSAEIIEELAGTV